MKFGVVILMHNRVKHGVPKTPTLPRFGRMVAWTKFIPAGRRAPPRALLGSLAKL